MSIGQAHTPYGFGLFSTDTIICHHPIVEANRVFLTRHFLGGMAEDDALAFLLQRMQRTKSNREFFASMAE